MKDKLVKHHHGRRYYPARRILFGASAILLGVGVATVPLTMALTDIVKASEINEKIPDKTLDILLS